MCEDRKIPGLHICNLGIFLPCECSVVLVTLTVLKNTLHLCYLFCYPVSRVALFSMTRHSKRTANITKGQQSNHTLPPLHLFNYSDPVVSALFFHS